MFPDHQEDHITQVAEETEERVTKRLAPEFSRTKNSILGALGRLDDFLMNPLIQGHSGTAPGTSRNDWSTSQGRNKDESQKDPHPEAGIFQKQMSQNSGPEHGHDITTGVTEEIRNRYDMVTVVHEKITYCSPSTSSGKQKKTALPVNRKSHATINADQVLLDLQQLAKNNNSANFHYNNNRNSKLPKSLTTTMPTFNGKSEKFDLFEDLSQTSLKIHNYVTEDNRINYFHSLMRGDAWRTFKNFNVPSRENLEEILAVFRRKYVKPQSMATSQHNFQKLVFNPANQKLVDFPDELQKLAKNSFGIAAHAIIEQIIYAKMLPHLQKSINQAHFENGTYEQIVTNVEKEL